MRKTHVFIVIATFHPILGGAEKQALEQGRSLRQRGLDATIVTFRHNKSWPAHETMDGVPVMRIAGTLLGRREKLPRVLQKCLYIMALIAMGWTLWRYRRRYDILHVYQLTLLALPTALACYLSGKPMVIAVRNADSGRKDGPQQQAALIAGQSTAHNPMLQADQEQELRSGGDLKDLERLGKPAVRFTRYLLQRIHAVVIILSTRMREYLVDHDFTLGDVQLIPNGVDTSRLYPLSTEASLSQSGQTVVCTARLCYQKGVDVLLEAWHLVHQELPTARLIIAGDGPLEDQLVELSKTLDLGACVEFIGRQSDVAAVLHRGSIATLPSRWEGMSNAILEAMACGLPCVATRVSGTEDIITDGVNGLLVEPEDAQDLARALLVLLRDPASASAYGKAARATIEQDYALEHVTNVYLELYRRLVGDGMIVSQSKSLARKDANRCVE